jgi:hypothetical protein
MTKGRAAALTVAGAVIALVVAGVLVARNDDETAVVASDRLTPAPQLVGVDPITGKRVRLSDY